MDECLHDQEVMEFQNYFDFVFFWLIMVKFFVPMQTSSSTTQIRLLEKKKSYSTNIDCFVV